MVKYLQLDGVDDYILLPSFASITNIDFDVSITDTNGGYLYRPRSGSDKPGIYCSSSGNLSSDSGSVSVSPTTVAKNTRTTIRVSGTAWNSFVNGTIGKNSLGTDEFLAMNVFSVKFYNGATLIAHYDMSIGTVQDQSGNGNHATLTGGTWLDDGTGGTPTTQDGTISVIGTGTLASTGRILKNSSASLVGTGSLSATATKVQNALAQMVGTGTLTATPVTIKNGQASVVGQGLFIANASTQSGIVIVDGNASLLGNGVFGATATTIIQGNASLLGQGVFTSNGIREAFGAVSFIGNGLFNVDLREITVVTGEAWLMGSGILEAKAQGRTWEEAPYLAVPMYAVVQTTEKNWKEVIQEKVKF